MNTWIPYPEIRIQICDLVKKSAVVTNSPHDFSANNPMFILQEMLSREETEFK